MSSPVKALVWKEWREQRPLVIAGLLLAAAMPLFLIAGAATLQRSVDLATLADAMPLFLAGLLWPFLTAACGAGTISGEIGDGTIGFLLSRPASRGQIWLVKVAVAGLALLLVVVGSLAVAALFQQLARGQGSDDVIRSLSYLDHNSVVGAFTVISIAGSLFLLFALAVFFSTFLSRALTAAAAGLAAALAVISTVFLIWSRLDLMPRFEPELMAVELGAAGLLVMTSSLYLFTRGELLSGRRVLRTAVFGSALALAGLAVVSAPLFYAHTRLVPQNALLHDVRVVPDGSAVLATASGEDGASAQSWLIYLDGSGIERITGRLALKPAVSPDGGWILYFSQRGALGLRTDSVSLRAVRTDGSADRLVTADLPGRPDYLHAVGGILFSPDSRRAAVQYGRWLVIAAVDGSVSRVDDFQDTDFAHSSILGWSGDGTELILASRFWGKEPGTTIFGFDPDTDELRVVLRSELRRVFLPRMRGFEAGSDLIPIALLEADDRITTLLVNVASGEVEQISQSSCSGAIDVSGDGRSVVYGVCDTTSPQRYETRIHFRDRGATEPAASATLEGRIWNLVLSPSGDRAVMGRYAVAGGRARSTVVGRDGRLVEFEEGWRPLGWTGRSGVVLVGSQGTGVRRLAVGDADTGQLRVAYP